jgi:hypothetical protein
MNNTSAPRNYRLWVLCGAILGVVVVILYLVMAEHVEKREFECMQRCGSRGLNYNYQPPSGGARVTSMGHCECRK